MIRPVMAIPTTAARLYRVVRWPTRQTILYGAALVIPQNKVAALRTGQAPLVGEETEEGRMLPYAPSAFPLRQKAGNWRVCSCK